MAGLHIALHTALLDRRKSIVAANALYGATTNMLVKVMEPFGVETTFVDICDTEAVAKAIEQNKPGCVLMETISNPLLRVGEMDRIAELTKAAGAALVVDNTFATPLLIRPLELGANIVVHSATKYLAGHGDVMGGIVVADVDHLESLRALSRIYGPTLGPFESYLTMRGIKTFALRVERQNRNACKVASWLAAHPGVAKVNFPSDPKHPDAATIARLFPKDFYGAMISFELKDAGRTEVFTWMEKLKMIVRATSLGDVHTMALYPAMSSHRDLAPKQRERVGIGDNLIRISVGIEAAEDIMADLEQAFA
jgi:cystathionine gamma-synthase/methionine-gamma-lyase